MLVLLCIAVFGAQIAGHRAATARPLDVAGYLLLVAGVVILPWRSLFRVPAYVITCGTLAAYLICGYPFGPVFLAALVSVFGVIRTGHRRAAWAVTWLSYFTVVLLPVFVHSVGGLRLHRTGLGSAIFIGLWVLIALGVADIVRGRGEQMAQVARTRAEQARARAEQERRQASEERLRIARELHDVLGHHLSLINVRAGVGLHLMDEQPDQARMALEAIKQASAEALAEVRGVLSLLRPEGEDAPKAPAPSLANIATLVGPSDLAVVGEAVPLSPEVDRAAYRIVQESLTNVRRHAGVGARARVTIRYRPENLVVSIADDGAGPSPQPDTDGGNGIAGMRARAEALGGTLAAGAGLRGGFQVTATLPLRVADGDGAEPATEPATGPADVADTGYGAGDRAVTEREAT